MILGLFCLVTLLGAYGDGAGGLDEPWVSLRPETPPAGGAGGSGGICGEMPRCPNKPTQFCLCGYICPDKECLPVPPYCEKDKDCPSGVCLGGKCKCSQVPGVDECNPPQRDEHSYTCSGEGYCVQLPDQCEGEGTECGDEGEGVCRRSQCYERCTSDRDCPASLVCKTDRFCGAVMIADGPPPAYSCKARGGEAEGRGAWLFVLVGIAAAIRARSRR
ncbi:hypothetical protein [Polyangium sorediatum]|uniref:Uncharacterized protein n=1 Tax=Polyangium sorediatum TaxID=889274 RepID=A0ABT6P1Z9_9BACT|nr:hypothetical protein [Polyangium sorediatum]MDI1434285.1 hypothetical protein [Polyangium sorediatum]